MYLQVLGISKAITFRLRFIPLLVCVFLGNQTHDLASTMLHKMKNINNIKTVNIVFSIINIW